MNKFSLKSNIYFNDLKIINNKVEASCKICRKKIIAGISSSSNLRRHYRTVHHTKLDEYDVSKIIRVKCEHNENSKKRQLQEPSEPSYTKKIKQSSLVQLSIFQLFNFSFEYSINSAIIATISNPKFKLNWLSNYVEEKDMLIDISQITRFI